METRIGVFRIIARKLRRARGLYGQTVLKYVYGSQPLLILDGPNHDRLAGPVMHKLQTGESNFRRNSGQYSGFQPGVVDLAEYNFLQKSYRNSEKCQVKRKSRNEPQKASFRADSRPDDRDQRVRGTVDDAPCRWEGRARARQAQVWVGRAAGSSSAASGRGGAIG